MTLKIFYLVSDIHNTGIHVQLFGSETARDQALKLVMGEWLDVREKDWPSRPDVIGLRERLSAGDINTAWLWFEEECRNPDDMYQVHEEMVEVEMPQKVAEALKHVEERLGDACDFGVQDKSPFYPSWLKVKEALAKSPPEPC